MELGSHSYKKFYKIDKLDRNFVIWEELTQSQNIYLKKMDTYYNGF